jgi:hypothetical protein
MYYEKIIQTVIDITWKLIGLSGYAFIILCIGLMIFLYPSKKEEYKPSIYIVKQHGWTCVNPYTDPTTNWTCTKDKE